MTSYQRFFIGGSGGASALADAGLLILRLLAGFALAYYHGLGKLPPSPGFIEGVAAMGFPAPTFFAWAAGLAETVGGAFLALGLLTRPASFFILCTMASAFFLRHAEDTFPQAEKAYLFGSIALCFLLIGAGRFSLDRLLRGWLVTPRVSRYAR